MSSSRDRLLAPHRSLLIGAAVCAAASIACIAVVDDPFARWIATRETMPAVWDRGVALLEYAAMIEPWKWLGVYVLCAGVLATLAIPRLRDRAPAWMFVALTHLLSRNVMSWGKFLTGRLRPTEWLARGGHGWFRDGGFSFPSGHVMYFASLAVPLAVVVPQARPLLACVAFAMIARVAVDAHFLSDVLAGLGLVLAITWLCAAALARVARSPSPRSSPR